MRSSDLWTYMQTDHCMHSKQRNVKKHEAFNAQLPLCTFLSNPLWLLLFSSTHATSHRTRPWHFSERQNVLGVPLPIITQCSILKNKHVSYKTYILKSLPYTHFVVKKKGKKKKSTCKSCQFNANSSNGVVQCSQYRLSFPMALLGAFSLSQTSNFYLSIKTNNQTTEPGQTQSPSLRLPSASSKAMYLKPILLRFLDYLCS